MEPVSGHVYRFPLHYAAPEVPLICIEVLLDGQHPARFVIDTGNAAGRMFVSEALAEKLMVRRRACPGVGTERVAVGSEAMPQAYYGTLDSFEAADFRINRPKVFVAGIIDNLAAAAKCQIDGLLGYQFLRGAAVTFDYGAMEMTLDFAPPKDTNASRLGLGRPAPLTIVDVDIEGCGLRKFVLDTGAGMECISRRLMSDLGLVSKAKTPMQGAAGVEEGDVVDFPPMTVAGHVLTGLDAAAADFVSEFGAMVGQEVDGILGYTGLKQAIFTLDYRNKRISARPQV